MAGTGTGASQHALADRKDDLYQTPPEAMRALLAIETLPRSIWEPACGPGSIVQVLRDAGHEVCATDLVDYGCPLQQVGVDFLMELSPPLGIECIVTNPPYKLATEFAEQAIRLAPEVYFLLRLAFLESEKRSKVLEFAGLRKVYVFRNRLPMMHREGWEGPKASSSTAFAWFCWSRGFTGQPTIERISWR